MMVSAGRREVGPPKDSATERRSAEVAPDTAATGDSQVPVFKPSCRRHWTARGWGLGLVGLAGLLAGVLLAVPLATTIGTVLVIGLLVDRLTLILSTWDWARLDSSSRLRPNPVMALETTTLSWQFDREINIDINQSMEPARVQGPRPTGIPLVSLTNLPAGQLEIAAITRGIYQLPEALGRRYGPMGLSRADLRLPPPAALIVWPEYDNFDLGAAPGATADDGLLGWPQPTPEDITVREYRSSDEWRRIHWRASARRGQLMSRAEEPTHTPIANLTLAAGVIDAPSTLSRRDRTGIDDQSDGPATDGELAISLLASAVVALAGQGLQVSLRTGEQPGVVAEVADHLTQLAGVGFEDSNLATAFEAEELGSALELVVACGRASDEDLATFAAEKARPASSSQAATKLALLIGPAAELAPRLGRTNWTVLTADSTTDREVIGQQLADVLAEAIRGAR